MMTQENDARALVLAAQARLDRDEEALKTQRSTIRRLASNPLERVSPDYQILVLLARVQERRWEIAESELIVLEQLPEDSGVLPPAARLGWRDRLAGFLDRLSSFVRG